MHVWAARPVRLPQRPELFLGRVAVIGLSVPNSLLGEVTAVIQPVLPCVLFPFRRRGLLHYHIALSHA